MNENVGVADCIEGAPFAIVDSHCETSRIAHGFQDQPVYRSIAECCYVLRLIVQDELPLLFVVTSLLV